MQFPRPGFLEIVILGTLLDSDVPGETLRRRLRKEFGWSGNDQQFFMVIGRLKKSEWITIQKQVASSERQTRQESSYSITDAGRAQWKYSYAFCRTICDRWQEEADLLPEAAAPPEPIEPVAKKRLAARLPTLEETVLILREAPPEFGVIFKLAVATGKCIVSLSTIQITNVDQSTWTVRIPGRGNESEPSTIKVPELCRQEVSRAISRRRSGPVFVTGSGLAWKEENLRMCWRRIKTKLNLPQETVMPSARFL